MALPSIILAVAHILEVTMSQPIASQKLHGERRRESAQDLRDRGDAALTQIFSKHLFLGGLLRSYRDSKCDFRNIPELRAFGRSEK